MHLYIHIFLISVILVFSTKIHAASLSESAVERGINQVCSKYLEQIEASYDLKGINLTFAHPELPSQLPSLHISSQNYNNGASIFSATLIPDGDYCYLSTVIVTATNNQNCSEITQLKVSANNEINVAVYSDGRYTILTPSDNAYQILLTSLGNNGCIMTETRILWPGK
jgi:hypothetical protein